MKDYLFPYFWKNSSPICQSLDQWHCSESTWLLTTFEADLETCFLWLGHLQDGEEDTLHYGPEQSYFGTSNHTFPYKLDSKWASEQMSNVLAKQAVWSKRMNEQCKQASKRTSKLLSTQVPYTDWSDPQCLGLSMSSPDLPPLSSWLIYKPKSSFFKMHSLISTRGYVRRSFH